MTMHHAAAGYGPSVVCRRRRSWANLYGGMLGKPDFQSEGSQRRVLSMIDEANHFYSTKDT